jgi:hypothetical protein
MLEICLRDGDCSWRLYYLYCASWCLRLSPHFANSILHLCICFFFFFFLPTWAMNLTSNRIRKTLAGRGRDKWHGSNLMPFNSNLYFIFTHHLSLFELFFNYIFFYFEIFYFFLVIKENDFKLKPCLVKWIFLILVFLSN